MARVLALGPGRFSSLVDRAVLSFLRPVIGAERSRRESRAVEEGSVWKGLPGVADLCGILDE